MKNTKPEVNKSGKSEAPETRREEIVSYAGRGYTEYRLPNGEVVVEREEPRRKMLREAA